VVEDEGKRYTLGVLLQANFGRRSELLVAGVPVGKEVPEQPAYAALASKREDRDLGSVIVIVATDAPLLPHQLDRIARRVTMGIARSGAVAGNGSGDIFLAFSTANPEASAAKGLPSMQMLPNERITPFFTATVQAVDEAVMNALVAARTLTGFEGNTAIALPHEKLRAALKKYNRLEAP
jgi:L-aminopeptidase/D-esterase-like protein